MRIRVDRKRAEFELLFLGGKLQASHACAARRTLLMGRDTRPEFFAASITQPSEHRAPPDTRAGSVLRASVPRAPDRRGRRPAAGKSELYQQTRRRFHHAWVGVNRA